MPLEPLKPPESTTFHCATPGCTTPAHDARDAHVHTFNEATRKYLEAEAAATAKKTIPVTLVNCMRPDCTTPPHGQDIEHTHTFAFQQERHTMTYTYAYVPANPGNLKMIIDGGNSKKPQPRPLTPTEISERWPTSPPENLALPVGQWLHRDTAARAIAKANGSDDPETGMSWLVAMIQKGMVDAKENNVRLMPENERPGSPSFAARPGSPEAVTEQTRLRSLAADLKALGYTVTKTPTEDHPA